MEGETKEKAVGWGDGAGGSICDSRFIWNEDTNDKDDDEDENEELVDLPADIVEEIGEFFESQGALIAALEEAGVDDLPVVLLDGKPRLVSPSAQHNAFTNDYYCDFNRWARCWKMKRWEFQWGVTRAKNNIHLENGGYLSPDLSFWGYPQCHKNRRGRLVPYGFEMCRMPDVIIEFNWRNPAKYEEDKIDHTTNQALEEEAKQGHGVLSTCPNVGRTG